LIGPLPFRVVLSHLRCRTGTGNRGVDMGILIHHFLIGSAAAASFELLRLWDARQTLTSKKYALLIRSPLFWAVALGMVAASGFFSWVFYVDRPDTTAAELAVAAVAARSLVRQGTGTLLGKNTVKLGPTDEQVSLGDVLR
jgi:hypothetical protein